MADKPKTQEKCHIKDCPKKRTGKLSLQMQILTLWVLFKFMRRKLEVREV